jgi:acetoacetate decarboxylase
MKAEDLRKTAFAMPHHNPSYPVGPTGSWIGST